MSRQNNDMHLKKKNRKCYHFLGANSVSGAESWLESIWINLLNYSLGESFLEIPWAGNYTFCFPNEDPNETGNGGRGQWGLHLLQGLQWMQSQNWTKICMTPNVCEAVSTQLSRFTSLCRQEGVRKFYLRMFLKQNLPLWNGCRWFFYRSVQKWIREGQAYVREIFRDLKRHFMCAVLLGNVYSK